LRRPEIYHTTDYAFWVGGYPRSGNVFVAKALERSLNGLTGRQVFFPLHVPPPIIRALRDGKPGIFVLREPAAAAISWAQHTGFSLRHCLDYYLDFHTILMPYRSRLFIAPFKEATTDVRTTVTRFGLAYGLHPESDRIDGDAILREIDLMAADADGRVNEMRVSRPSPERTRAKKPYRDLIEASPILQRKIDKANALYSSFYGAGLQRMGVGPAGALIAAAAGILML
jgi:hypothetical protein